MQIGLGLSLGRGGLSALNAAKIFGSITRQYVRADTVTVATGVSILPDVTGQTAPYVQATAGAQPAWSTNGGPGGRPCMIGNTTSRILNCATFTPAGPCFVWGLIRLDTYTVNRALFGQASGAGLISPIVWAAGGTPNMQATAGTFTGVVPATLGTWFRLEAWFNNSPQDYIKIGPNAASGATGVIGAGVGRSIFGNGGTNFLGASVSELLYADALPSAGQFADADTYAAAMGAAV